MLIAECGLGELQHLLGNAACLVAGLLSQQAHPCITLAPQDGGYRGCCCWARTVHNETLWRGSCHLLVSEISYPFAQRSLDEVPCNCISCKMPLSKHFSHCNACKSCVAACDSLLQGISPYRRLTLPIFNHNYSKESV